MTENEAIEWLAEETSPTLIHIAEMKKENPMEYINEAVKVACHALEEIQQYREIGTVEGYERAIETSKENYLLYAEYKSKLQAFEAIGTIEEFKDLKEKATPKKPIYSDFDENEAGDIIPYKAVCPICGHEFEFGTWNDEENHHCVCDQKMDWE